MVFLYTIHMTIYMYTCMTINFVIRQADISTIGIEAQSLLILSLAGVLLFSFCAVGD